MTMNSQSPFSKITEKFQRFIAQVENRFNQLDRERGMISSKGLKFFLGTTLILMPLIAVLIVTFHKNQSTITTPQGDVTATNQTSGVTVTASKGIFLNKDGRLYTINTRVQGVVKKIDVIPSEEVKEGQLVAEISDHDYEIRYATAAAKFQEETEDLKTLTEQIEREGKAQREAYEAQLGASEYGLEQINQKIEHIQADLDKKKMLYEQRLVSLATIRDVEDLLSSTKVERESMKSTISDLRYNHTRGYRTEDLKAKQDELIQVKEELKLLEFQKKYYMVASPKVGTVLDILVSPGQIVNRGDVLIALEAKSNGPDELRVYAFIPLDKGKQIFKGDEALITPLGLDVTTYGMLRGKVVQVSKYPVSPDSVTKIIYNMNLVNYLLGSDPVYEVIIEPVWDANTKKLQWTKGKEPPYPLTAGTICTVTISGSHN